ncbi:MAG: dTMP kinase [Chthoniobacterales bacterium]
MQRGIFITFEGSEGCGKSTQITRLGETLKQTGKRILMLREPGGTELGEQIRHLLKYFHTASGMFPETELLLFAASRAQLVREVIEPALSEGCIVLSDRFMDSTTVYQGVARKIDASTVETINAFAVGSCLPELTFLLDMDAEVAFQRTLRRPRSLDAPKDRMEQEPLSFYHAVREGYLALAKKEPKRIKIINSERPVTEVQEVIRQTLHEQVHGLFL